MGLVPEELDRRMNVLVVMRRDDRVFILEGPGLDELDWMYDLLFFYSGDQVGSCLERTSVKGYQWLPRNWIAV